MKKTAEVAVFEGKSYYLHTVGEGQTLYSIAKAYDIKVELLKELNNIKDNKISILDVLKIPFVEIFVEKDNKYYYHKVNKGETLYSISRRYGIKVREIIRENPQSDKELRVGDVVRLLLKEITQLPATEHKTESAPVENILQEIKVPEAAKEFADKMSTPDTMLHKQALKIQPVFSGTDSASRYVTVAVILPFYAKENFVKEEPAYLDTLFMEEKKEYKEQIIRKSEQFIYFYEGVLLALDSLKKMGYMVNLHVFDTYRNNANMYDIVSKINELNPDLIIGPVYASEAKILVEHMNNKNIPVIYPLSPRGDEELYKYSNFLQVNISYNSLVDKMLHWVADRCAEDAHVMTIDFYADWTYDTIAPVIVKDRLTSGLLAKPEVVTFFKWDLIAASPDTLRSYLIKEKQNIVVIPTTEEREVSKILPVLSSYADQFKITVLGFPEWQNFLTVDHETYYKLNVKFFTYSYVNNYSENAMYFSRLYRSFFYGEPHTLTNKAFDLAMYFIPLTAKYRNQTIEALTSDSKEEMFSYFKFRETALPKGADTLTEKRGIENKGLFIVNYGSNYRINIEHLYLSEQTRPKEYDVQPADSGLNEGKIEYEEFEIDE